VPDAIELVVVRLCEHVLHQSAKFLVRQGCELQQAGVQALELALGHRAEVEATNMLLRARALQPTKKDLCSTRIRDRALTQTTFDFGIGRRRTVTTRCAALAAQPCGFACLLLRPPVWSSSDLVSLGLSKSVSFLQLGRESSPLVADFQHA
jgi:hypothetical protein